MEEKKAAIIRDWVEPAHPMVVKFHDDLIAIYKRLREQFQEGIDLTFDKVSREIGFLVTTTLPLTIEFAEEGRVKNIELSGEHLKNTLFGKDFKPILKKISSKYPEFASSITPGTYNLYMICFNALKLKLRTDWIEPAHFRNYLHIREHLGQFLRRDWVEPAHVVLGDTGFAAVDPNVMEPAHFKPSTDLWRDKVLITAIDEVYPELRLVERISKLKEMIRVRPEVMEPAHFRDIGRTLPREALIQIEAVLRRYGYK